MRRWVSLIAASWLSACSGRAPGDLDATTEASPPPDAGYFDVFTSPDGDPDVPPVDAGPSRSAIEHVIVIVQENHTFDAYFGRYCTAPTGSDPACTTGPACCEAAPTMDPAGTPRTTLDDGENGGYDPTHTQACELTEMNGSRMDRYTHTASCSDVRNFAVAPTSSVSTYVGYAQQYALADRYFQPIVGQSSSNDMYLAVAHSQFIDNQFKPSSIGQGCSLPATTARYVGRTTVADLLIDAGYTFRTYAEGYDVMRSASTCPLPPSDCPLHLPITPCNYDPSDIPFEYYAQFTDDPTYMFDLGDFFTQLGNGDLPNMAYVKFVGYHNEHPGYGTTISAGEASVDHLVQAVMASPLAASTLILLTWDEGGGFFDHVAPPDAVDGDAYGTRIPMLAIGPFARVNHVSHTPMEHSSIVRFVEWNFLGETGQLGARDAVVHNIGSMLDPAMTGLAVPE